MARRGRRGMVSERWRAVAGQGDVCLPVLDHSARPGLLVALAASMQVGAKKVLSHKAMHQYFKDLALIWVHGASGQRGVTSRWGRNLWLSLV